MRILAILLLAVAAVAHAPLVHAQVAILCRTPLTTCPSTSDEILPGRPCWCDTSDGPAVGQTEYTQRRAHEPPAKQPGGETERSVGIRATREFVTPSQLPPDDFAAYGLVLFKSLATSHDIARHKLICEAYLASLPEVGELQVPTREQMVTVWPIASPEAADDLATLPRDAICDAAVAHYSLAYALDTLERLREYDTVYGTYDLSGVGPFLVAWAPGSKVFDTSSIALFLDLSDVDTPEQAQHEFDLWRTRIQSNPDLWRDGFQRESLLTTIRTFFDRYGAIIEVAK